MILRSQWAACACLAAAATAAATPLASTALDDRHLGSLLEPGRVAAPVAATSQSPPNDYITNLKEMLATHTGQLAAARDNAARMQAEVDSLRKRRRELEQQAGHVGIRLEDLLDDLQDRRQRMMDLDIERSVAGATTDFLRSRLEELLARIERGLKQDQVLARMRDEEAMLREQLKAGFVAPPEITRLMDRRFAREEAVAERLGRSLVLDLESRLIQAELDLMAANVRHRILAEQVAETIDRTERLAGVEAVEDELPIARSNLAKADERVRELRNLVEDLERQLSAAEREASRPGGTGQSGAGEPGGPWGEGGSGRAGAGTGGRV